jgi:hypothetical protein
MGTSAGALTGALYAAGHAPDALAAVLSERTPLSYLVRRSLISVIASFLRHPVHASHYPPSFYPLAHPFRC